MWKQENEVNGTTLTTAEIVVLQEDLGLSRYFLDSACSRSTALYNPHIDYWRNGNNIAKQNWEIVEDFEVLSLKFLSNSFEMVCGLGV